MNEISVFIMGASGPFMNGINGFIIRPHMPLPPYADTRSL